MPTKLKSRNCIKCKEPYTPKVRWQETCGKKKCQNAVKNARRAAKVRRWKKIAEQFEAEGVSE
jgi:hypothetical protein